jgi:hypothetical protein
MCLRSLHSYFSDPGTANSECGNENQNESGSSSVQQPYLRLGLSRRGKARKPLHENVKFISCESDEEPDFEVEEEDDE